jgi:hypothetical protein
MIVKHMIVKQWRQRITFAAMSLFVAWHTAAMVIAPAPQSSEAVQSLRRLFNLYLATFRLDNAWDFYAPIVGLGQELHYVVNARDGTRVTFVATADLSSLHPHFWWFRAWHNKLLEIPEIYGDYFAALQCRKHAAMRPISIELIKVEQKEFSKDDYFSGKLPMDAEFLTEETLRSVQCPDG